MNSVSSHPTAGLRWGLAGSLPDGREQLVMSNYLSIGVDARASLNWARLKAAAPALFSLRLLAKLWYIVLGTPELLLRSHRDLPSRLTLTCDGQRIPLPRRCQGLMARLPRCGTRRCGFRRAQRQRRRSHSLIAWRAAPQVCNTPSYGGGSDLWDPTQGAPLPSRDRMQTEAVPPAAVRTNPPSTPLPDAAPRADVLLFTPVRAVSRTTASSRSSA